MLILIRALPGLEASMYGFVRYDYPSNPTLSCPLLMTWLDRESVTIKLKNPLERTLTYYVKAEFSTNQIIKKVEQRIEVPPREIKTITWEVDKENIDLKYFIFANVFTSPSAALKMTATNCGTLVLKIPIAGGTKLFLATLVLVGLFLGVGLWLWLRHSEKSAPGMRAQAGWMLFVSVVVVIGVISGIFNWWFLGIVTVLLTILTVSVFLIPGKF